MIGRSDVAIGMSSVRSRLPLGPMSQYRTQSPDTSFDAERFLICRYRAMSPADKLSIFRQLSQTAQALALAGLRRRHPEASPRELQLRLAATRLDEETLRAVFGWPETK